MVDDSPVTYVRECGEDWKPLAGAMVHYVRGQAGHEEAAQTVAGRLDKGIRDVEQIGRVRRFRVWKVGGRPLLVIVKGVVRVTYHSSLEGYEEAG